MTDGGGYPEESQRPRNDPGHSLFWVKLMAVLFVAAFGFWRLVL